MTPQIDIIIVTYGSSGLIGECLSSLFADPLIGHCVVTVVDNDSADAEATRRIVSGFPHARFLASGRNGGFGAGNNIGIARSTAPLVLIANPDTRLHAGGLAGLVAFMHSHPLAGLVGPALLNEDGSLQHSIRRYPTPGRELLEGLLLHRLAPRLTRGLTHVDESPASYALDTRVEWVSGAVMLARTHALTSIGGFDEGFFLYSEEIDLCRRLEDAGWRIWFTPSVSFLHIGGENDESVLLGLETQRSKLRYFRKHQGRLAMTLAALATAVRLLVRAVVWLPAAALDGDGSWGRRLRTDLHVLARYPALLTEFLLAEVPPGVAQDDSRAQVVRQ